jgi:competence protein ComGC
VSRSLPSPIPIQIARIDRAQAGQTLVGLLVVLVIIAILAVIMVPQIAGRHHEKGQPLTPRERGYQAACGIYESQINQSIMMYRQDHNSNPPSLDALKRYGLTDDMIHSPDCVFQYDPQTGIAKNAAEGAQGVGGVVNPTGQEQFRPGQPAQDTSQPAAPYASHSIAPPGAAQPAGRGALSVGPGPSGGRGGGTPLPGGLHLPNMNNGMGGSSSDDGQ